MAEHSTPSGLGFPSEASLLDSILADSNAQVTKIATPFFHNTTIDCIEKRLPTHPVVYYFSRGPQEKVLNLTGNPEKLQAAAVEDKLTLSSNEDAAAYIAVAFQVCKGRKGYLLTETAEFRFFPKLTTEETERKDKLLTTYSSRLHSPRAETSQGGFQVRYFFVEDRELRRVDVALQANGAWNEAVVVLEKEMPVVWIK